MILFDKSKTLFVILDMAPSMARTGPVLVRDTTIQAYQCD
jgi:hypothetical protein